MKTCAKTILAGGIVAFSLMLLPAQRGLAAAVPVFCQTMAAKDVRPASTTRTGVILIANKKHVLAGTRILARLVNFSSTKASYGREFRIEKYVAGLWTIDESSPK